MPRIGGRRERLPYPLTTRGSTQQILGRAWPITFSYERARLVLVIALPLMASEEPLHLFKRELAVIILVRIVEHAGVDGLHLLK